MSENQTVTGGMRPMLSGSRLSPNNGRAHCRKEILMDEIICDNILVCIYLVPFCGFSSLLFQFELAPAICFMSLQFLPACVNFSGIFQEFSPIGIRELLLHNA